MSDLENLGKIVDQLVYKVIYGPEGESVLWEHKLRLHLRPKPAWCPLRLWAKLVSLVLVQSYEGLC